MHLLKKAKPTPKIDSKKPIAPQIIRDRITAQKVREQLNALIDWVNTK